MKTVNAVKRQCRLLKRCALAASTLVGLLGLGVLTSCSSADNDAPSSCGPSGKAHHPSSVGWTYGAPEDWSDLHGDFAACGNGERQTPIDLKDSEAIATNSSVGFWGYEKSIPLQIENNGHTLQVNYKGSKSSDDPHVTYKGKEYYLLQLHFHTPSEHTINGEHASMEVHFVHEAADGARAVVGVLMSDGDASSEVEKLLSNKPRADEMVHACDASLALSALLPQGRRSFHYSGSLTTPPCSEGLQWWVLADHISVSSAQREAYASLFPTETNRPVQSLNGRVLELYTTSP